MEPKSYKHEAVRKTVDEDATINPQGARKLATRGEVLAMLKRKKKEPRLNDGSMGGYVDIQIEMRDDIKKYEDSLEALIMFLTIIHLGRDDAENEVYIINSEKSIALMKKKATAQDGRIRGMSDYMSLVDVSSILTMLRMSIGAPYLVKTGIFKGMMSAEGKEYRILAGVVLITPRTSARIFTTQVRGAINALGNIPDVKSPVSAVTTDNLEEGDKQLLTGTKWSADARSFMLNGFIAKLRDRNAQVSRDLMRDKTTGALHVDFDREVKSVVEDESKHYNPTNIKGGGQIEDKIKQIKEKDEGKNESLDLEGSVSSSEKDKAKEKDQKDADEAKEEEKNDEEGKTNTGKVKDKKKELELADKSEDEMAKMYSSGVMTDSEKDLLKKKILLLPENGFALPITSTSDITLKFDDFSDYLGPYTQKNYTLWNEIFKHVINHHYEGSTMSKAQKEKAVKAAVEKLAEAMTKWEDDTGLTATGKTKKKMKEKGTGKQDTKEGKKKKKEKTAEENKEDEVEEDDDEEEDGATKKEMKTKPKGKGASKKNKKNKNKKK